MEGGRYLGKTGIMWKQIWEHFGQIFGGKFVRTIALSLIQSFSRGVGFRCRHRWHFLVVKSTHPRGAAAAGRISLIFQIFLPHFFDNVTTNCTPPLNFIFTENNMFPLEISSPIKRRALGPVGTISVPLGNIWLFLASKSQIFHPVLWKLGQIRTHNKMR